MLVLSRKKGEQIVIGNNITVVVQRLSGNRVSIGVQAPKNTRIVRGELQLTAAPIDTTSEVQPCSPAIG